jgi:hypothetical protein
MQAQKYDNLQPGGRDGFPWSILTFRPPYAGTPMFLIARSQNNKLDWTGRTRFHQCHGVMLRPLGYGATCLPEKHISDNLRSSCAVGTPCPDDLPRFSKDGGIITAEHAVGATWSPQ